jgi:ferredoxin
MDMHVTVTFSFSDEIHVWTDDDTNLLQFAEKHGIEISSGCQYGDCGTCLTDLLSGDVEYLHETGVKPDPNTCLPCSCKPRTSIVLGA